MKKLFKGAIPTIAMLLVAVMSLSSITFAWFTAGDKATLDSFEVNVKAVDGVMVSSTGYNGQWASSMTPYFSDTEPTAGASVTATDAKYFSDYKLQPVSGYDNEGTLEFYNATYDKTKSALTDASKVSARVPTGSSNANYVKFSFYIKNDSATAAKTITIAKNSDVSTVTGSAMTRAATRVAFVNAGTASASAVLNDSTAPSVTGDEDLIAIWEPNATEHTPDGVKTVTAGTVDSSMLVIADEFSSAIIDSRTGKSYTLYATQLSYTDSVPAPKDGKYYVVDTAKESFRELAVKDFFEVVTFATALTMDKDALYTANSDQTAFTALDDDAVLTNGNIYYKKVDIEASTKAYTAADSEKLEASDAVETANVTFDVAANTIVKIDVYIWIEGQDVDCTDYIAGNSFKVDLKLFAAAKKAD